jgi:hypothetical protein
LRVHDSLLGFSFLVPFSLNLGTENTAMPPTRSAVRAKLAIPITRHILVFLLIFKQKKKRGLRFILFLSLCLAVVFVV